MNTTLEIRNLTKKIGKKTIIDDVSFDVQKGEVFGLLGPNGAGKTTIIRMIPGVTEERIDEVVELVKLENRIDNEVKTYSLGMHQRLGVAQALLHKPSVLILDEPTNGLDPAGIHELRDYLRRLAEAEGTTIIVSSHLLLEMEVMCNRVAIIQDGQLVDVKTMKQLKADAAGQRRVQFEVDHPERACELVHQLYDGLPMKQLEHGFEVALPKEAIAKLNEAFVNDGIKVFQIRSIEKTLEERFLEITGGVQHD
jgi:ABC-2 type transport system ATP-binding protein